MLSEKLRQYAAACWKEAKKNLGTLGQMLQEKLTVNGHSMSNPILNEDGTVNMEASRRVEVKFRLKDEDMISEMSKIVAEE